MFYVGLPFEFIVQKVGRGWLLPKHRRSWLSLNQQKYHILLIPTTLPFSYFLGFFFWISSDIGIIEQERRDMSRVLSFWQEVGCSES